MGRWSKQKREGIRRAWVGDLNRLLRAAHDGTLVDDDGSRCCQIKAMLRANEFPPPKEECRRLNLTNAERDLHRAWGFDPTDLTAQEFIKRKKLKKRERKMRERGGKNRAEYLASVSVGEPWVSLSMAKSTYYDHKKKGLLPEPDRFARQDRFVTCQSGQVVAQQDGLSPPIIKLRGM
jgi:hypothetical protein